jgi:hypothetical protein
MERPALLRLLFGFEGVCTLVPAVVETRLRHFSGTGRRG